MQKIVRSGDRIIRWVNKICYHLACAMVTGMVLNVVLAVVFNKILGRAFPIPVDYTGYLLLMAVCLGYAGYQYKNGFVRVTMLTEHFPQGAAKATELGVFTILILFYGFLSLQCMKTGKGMMISGQKMMSISWKIYPYYYILAAGFLWTAIVTVFQAAGYLLTWKEKEEKEEIT